MPLLAERLALLITANPDDAVRGLKKVGDTAERELGRTEDHTARMGAQFTRVGAGMVVTGAVILGGLAKAASAAEEANLAVLKLENSLAKNPNTAGASSKAFVDLADSIQDVTAADGDQIVAAEAMLATFRLTSDEMKQATPLVVDYARKFGIDLVSAATQVGKAISGNIGALQRNGVLIDENAFAADRFGAVMGALRENAGGFAEQEGATFAGSLERLKNQLGDVVEGIGTGAVDAFQTMFGAVESATGALDRLDPSAQASIGRLATYGATGAVVVGATATMVGWLTRLRTTFTRVSGEGAAATRSLTGVGKALTGLGVVATVAGLVDAAKATTGLRVEVDRLAQATDQQLVRAFHGVQKAVDIFGEGFDPLGQGAIDAGDDMRVFRDIAEQSFGTAVRLRDGLKAAGDETKAYDAILREVADGQRQQTTDSASGAEAMRGYQSATSGATSALEAYVSQLDVSSGTTLNADFVDSLNSELGEQEATVVDLEGAWDKLNEQIGDYFEQITSNLDAQLGLEDSFAGLATALDENTGDWDTSTEAGRNNLRALLDVQDSIVGVGDALIEEGASNREAADAVKAHTDRLIEQLRQAGLTEDQIASLIQTIGLTPSQVDTAFLTNAALARGDVSGLINEMHGIPAEVVTRLTAEVTASLNGVNLSIARKSFAEGGVEDHQAQIATGGPIRVWAEPETGGESYIPLSPAKRSRSLRIWEETGRRLGVEHFADGGLFGPVQEALDFSVESIAAEIAEAVKAAWKPPLGPGAGWRAMMGALHGPFPGLPLLSGPREGAVTAPGGVSDHGPLANDGTIGRAVDVPPRMDVFDWIAANYGPETAELIFTPAGKRQLQNGSPHVYTGITAAMHKDHAHWAMDQGAILANVMDTGGVVASGTAMLNLSGRPEIALPPGIGVQRVTENINLVLDGAVAAQALRRHDRLNAGRS